MLEEKQIQQANPQGGLTQHTPKVDNPYVNAATADNTRQAYRSDMRHFERTGSPLPATAKDVAHYLMAFAEKLNSRTLTRRLTAIKHWHLYQGFPDPTDDPLIRKTLKGITNIHGKPKEKAPPLLPEQLQQIVAYLNKQTSLIAYRDSALLQLGFFAALRRSELVAIRFEHIQFCSQGIELLIPRSKTDQAGEGQYCAVPYGNEHLCAVHQLKRWLEQASISDGPVFRKIHKTGALGHQSLTPLAVTQIIKKYARACQLPDAQLYSSHSLRRGLAISASHKGASLKAIMQQGRWRDVSTVMGYLEEGQQFNDNAATIVLGDRPSQTSS